MAAQTLPPPAILAQKKELNLYAKEWVNDSHVSSLAAALTDNKSLTFVGLRECRRVGNVGVCALAKSIAVSKTLLKLTLESTGVGDQGVFALAKVP